MRSFKLAAHRRTDRIDFAGELNEQQLEVVTAPGGPMLVIAGAGSGKTRSLIYRLAWLLRQGVAPERILLMTFTNRAAREMVHRVQLLVHQDAQRIWAGTFHHVANRLLREHGRCVGLSPDFTILDREDAADLLAACVVEAGIRIEARRFPKTAVLLSINSRIASTLTPLPEVLHDRYPMFAGLREPISRVLELYESRKRLGNLADYDDLLGHWLTLLEREGQILSQLSERFQHILVDEYQDTNAIQGRIVDLLAQRHGNLCVVGDDSQSIYSFRGADFDNIIGFRERYPAASVHRLETNYRSTPEILALANASIEHNERRLPKRLRAVRPSGLRPTIVPCTDHFVQSRFIAEYILHLLDEGREVTDIAVLYRSHWHAMEIQLELQRRDIPFQVRGGVRFFEQAHVKDVLAFLRIRHNGHDELAWQRVLRLLPRIGGAISVRLWRELALADDPLDAFARIAASAPLPASTRRSLDRFASVVHRLASLVAPGEMIEQVLRDFYDDHLLGRYENAALRRQDLEGIADFAGQYRTVEAFLSDVALSGDFSGETCVEGPDEQLFVTLSTVHQAKGLEWPVVLIPWVADGRFPTDLAMNDPEDLEEERRVFHVALTRARDELYLLVPEIWSNYRSQRIVMKPSRFLSEIDQDALLEKMIIEGDLPPVTAG